jgi:hypothetical protein
MGMIRPVGVVAGSVRRLYTTTVSRQVDLIWARRSERRGKEARALEHLQQQC